MYDEWMNPEDEKREKRLSRWIIGLFLFVFFVGFLTLLSGCATCIPKKSNVQIKPFVTSDIILKGYDTDCDGNLDYWQHYFHGKKFGKRIWINE